jgi:hypothetical protein
MNLIPKKKLGKYSIIFITNFFLFLGLFFLLVKLGETGGETFFSNLKLTIPMLIASFSAITAFITGTINIIKNKEINILSILSTILGFLITIWWITEILFSH